MQKQQRPNSSPSDFLQHPPPPPTHFEVSKNKLIFTLDTNVVDVIPVRRRRGVSARGGE